MPYRGNGTWPPSWQTSTSPHSDLMQHEGRISALETTAEHHDERLEGLEEAAEEFRRHRSRSLGTVLEGWLPDIKWWIILVLLAGAKVTLPSYVQDILSGVAGGALGFG